MEIRPASAGDVFLSRDPDEPEIRRHLPGVPTLVHLEVLGTHQRRGIGTALVRASEDTARRLGHDRIALGVGLDNPGRPAALRAVRLPRLGPRARRHQLARAPAPAARRSP